MLSECVWGSCDPEGSLWQGLQAILETRCLCWQQNCSGERPSKHCKVISLDSMAGKTKAGKDGERTGNSKLDEVMQRICHSSRVIFVPVVVKRSSLFCIGFNEGDSCVVPPVVWCVSNSGACQRELQETAADAAWGRSDAPSPLVHQQLEEWGSTTETLCFLNWGSLWSLSSLEEKQGEAVQISCSQGCAFTICH